MRNYIWATDCPDCKSGIIALSEKGGIANCIVCGAEYHTDYEEHPELGTPETEYWLTDKVVPQPEIFTDEAIGDSGLDQFKPLKDQEKGHGQINGGNMKSWLCSHFQVAP